MLVLAAPTWAEPNARFALGAELMPLAHVARADSERFSRALEVSILGARHPDLARWRLESERAEGDFMLRIWSNPDPVTVLYDFLQHVEPPHLAVSVVRRNGGVDSCPFSTKHRVSNGDLGGHPTFPSERYACPGGSDWSFVGRTVIDDHDYRPRRCIWAHPIQGSVLTLRFDSVPIGSKLHGYSGLPYLFERERRGPPVELAIAIGGQDIGTARHVDGEGWKAFEFDTMSLRGQRLPVEFRVRSKREAWRQFCFQADIR